MNNEVEIKLATEDIEITEFLKPFKKVKDK